VSRFLLISNCTKRRKVIQGIKPIEQELTDENNSCFGNTYNHFMVKVKRDHVMFSLVFQTDPQTAISMKRARHELSIDVAVGSPTSKFKENTTWSRLSSPRNGFRCSQNKNSLQCSAGKTVSWFLDGFKVDSTSVARFRYFVNFNRV